MSENRISFADESDRAASTAEALRILRRDGVVVLDDLIDVQLIERCCQELEAGYPDMARPNRALNYGPYEGRHCTPVVVDQTLADPALLLPPPVSNIARTLLEEPYKVDSVGLLVAAPGAPDQIAHHDGWLFAKEGLDRLLPPFALAFSVPLVPMDETSGRTAFWLRSHRSASPTPEGPFDFAPTVNPGSAILWDFRVLHCGLANHGERPRPVIFTVLSREWWVEVQPPEATLYRKLRLSREVHSGFRPRWKARFSRAELVDAGR